jgi:uncharacterized protein
LLQFVAISLGAQSPGIERLFPDQPIGFLSDVAAVVPAAHARSLDSIIVRLRRATGAEIAVVTLPTIEDYQSSEVAVAIGRKWGVGAAAEQGDPRRNAGIVVLLVPRTPEASGKIFIAVGRGLEGIVTDLLAGRIRDQMRPYLSAGDYGPGLEVGVRSLADVIARGFGVTDSTLIAEDRSVVGRSGGRRNQLLPLAFVAIVILFVVLGSVQSRYHQGAGYPGSRRRRGRGRGNDWFVWPGGGIGGGWDGWGGGGGGGFGGFGGGGGFSGGGAGGDF